MVRKFAELEAKMSAESIARSDELYKKMLVELTLNELRTKDDRDGDSLRRELESMEPDVITKRGKKDLKGEPK